jgi:hypothetical protein
VWLRWGGARGVVWVIIRATDEITPTSVMKDIVEITTLAVDVTYHLMEREREKN